MEAIERYYHGVNILGVAHYLPKKTQTNEEVCEKLDGVTPEWIETKTGITKRYISDSTETASFMSTEACRRVLQNTGVLVEEIGLIVVVTYSQDYLFPPMSAKIHLELGAPKSCQIIDMNTNCTGFVTGLSVASERMLFDQSIKHSLVIGSEVLSSFTDPTDKDTAIYFSDGASAVLIGRELGRGYLGSKFMTDSSTYESVRLRGGGSSFPSTREIPESAKYIEQNGLATWKQAVVNLPILIKSFLEAQKFAVGEVDFFIFHQANKMLIEYILKKMKVPLDKTFINVDAIGNTGSASIGIALSEAFAQSKIKKGDNLLIAGVGAGFNFGVTLFKV